MEDEFAPPPPIPRREQLLNALTANPDGIVPAAAAFNPMTRFEPRFNPSERHTAFMQPIKFDEISVGDTNIIVRTRRRTSKAPHGITGHANAALNRIIEIGRSEKVADPLGRLPGPGIDFTILADDGTHGHFFLSDGSIERAEVTFWRHYEWVLVDLDSEDSIDMEGHWYKSITVHPNDRPSVGLVVQVMTLSQATLDAMKRNGTILYRLTPDFVTPKHGDQRGIPGMPGEEPQQGDGDGDPQPGEGDDNKQQAPGDGIPKMPGEGDDRTPNGNGSNAKLDHAARLEAERLAKGWWGTNE